MDTININALVEELKVWNHTESGPRRLAKLAQILYPDLVTDVFGEVVKIMSRAGETLYDSSTSNVLPTTAFAEIRARQNLKAIARLKWLDRYDVNPLTREIINSIANDAVIDLSAFSNPSSEVVSE